VESHQAGILGKDMGAIHKSLIIYLWLTIDHTSRKNKPRHPSSVEKSLLLTINSLLKGLMGGIYNIYRIA